VLPVVSMTNPYMERARTRLQPSVCDRVETSHTCGMTTAVEGGTETEPPGPRGREGLGAHARRLGVNEWTTYGLGRAGRGIRALERGRCFEFGLLIPDQAGVDLEAREGVGVWRWWRRWSPQWRVERDPHHSDLDRLRVLVKGIRLSIQRHQIASVLVNPH
jgi:hypothetical protein